MIVFITRYLDLLKVIVQPSRLGNFLTLYNTIMKILYISLTAYIVYLMKYKQPYKATYDKTLDTFRIFEFAILPCASLALFVRRHTDSFFFDVFESPLFPHSSSTLGPSPSTWKPFALCLNSLFFRDTERLRISRPTTFSCLELIASSTFWTGLFVILLRMDIRIGLFGLVVLFRLVCTLISSITTLWGMKWFLLLSITL